MRVRHPKNSTYGIISCFLPLLSDPLLLLFMVVDAAIQSELRRTMAKETVVTLEIFEGEK
jgi:hypothetical protein